MKWHTIQPAKPDRHARVMILGDRVTFEATGPRGGAHYHTVPAEGLLEAAALLLESRGDYRCTACLRPEADCSADPCQTVIEDRES